MATILYVSNIKNIHSRLTPKLINSNNYKRSIYVKPFEDIIKIKDNEFLLFDFTAKTNNILKPFVMNSNQQDILFPHYSKIDFISTFWKDFYDQNDPYQYWAYGIPKVIEEYRKIGGEFAPYAWVIGILATICSKEFVSFSGFQDFYVILFIIELVRRAWSDKVIKFYDDKENLRSNLTQKILDEPADAYLKIIDSLKQEQDYEYVRLMLANYKNDLVAMDNEIQYRTHLKTKYEQFIQRLEYQAEITQLKKYYNSLLLRTWLFPQVEESITPDVKEKVMDECLLILKSKAEAKKL